MAYPRRSRNYTLITNASLGDEKKAGGLGAILTQIDEKGEHTPAESCKNMSATTLRFYSRCKLVFGEWNISQYT